jgi:hypothetical protein
MAKTLDQGFETFLSWLVPLKTEHDKAASHRGSVESCLEKNFDCYRMFETGSFGNGTGVRHYSDTDYFAVCKTGKLFSDSGATLRSVKEALKATFWRTAGIEVHTPAVQIPFGTYSSETLEVTPCDYQGLVETPLGSKARYHIADGSGEWMYASPDAHNSYVKDQDKRLNGKLKPLIQLVKAWKFYNSVPISSFYLELRTTKYAEGESSIVYDIDLKRIFSYLAENELPSIRDPMGVSGMIAASNTSAKRESALSKIKTARSRAEKAWAVREKNLDDCFYWWDLLFNGEFPSR